MRKETEVTYMVGQRVLDSGSSRGRDRKTREVEICQSQKAKKNKVKEQKKNKKSKRKIG